mgnify:CR=1 FL=1
MNKFILKQEVENYIFILKQEVENYIFINNKIKECYGISK